MAEISKKIDFEKLVLYSDDLLQLLMDKNDDNDLIHCDEKSEALHYRCGSDDAAVQSLLEDYQKKIDLCKQKTEAAKAEVASDAEIDLLQKESEEELQREILLEEELRAITNEIKDLDEQRISIEERRQVLNKLKQDEKKLPGKLKMYANVTRIIPDKNDDSKMISGNVYKEKEVDERFELSLEEMSDFDVCNTIWKLIKD